KRGKSAHSLPRWMYRLPRHWVRKIKNISDSFLAGLRMLKSGRHLALVIVLSLASWLVHAIAVFSLLNAFGFELPFWGALVILIVNTAAIMIQISPGNLGTFQFACILGLSFFGIPKESALSFSLVLHVAETLPIALLGTYYSFSSHIRLKEYQTPESLREQEDFATGEYPFNGGREELPVSQPEETETKMVDER
ncbi:lysylphosphatidylglycerol synthase transmembrane domain-containing protein, partial [Candidatus Zixiibacteriota bacterium]